MTEPFIATREIIWHIACRSCNFYWTYPTMNSDETVTGREWHCPLCGNKGKAGQQESPVNERD